MILLMTISKVIFKEEKYTRVTLLELIFTGSLASAVRKLSHLHILANCCILLISFQDLMEEYITS